MAEDDRGREGPSLELPSWGFGRRRRKQEPTPEVADQPERTPRPPAERAPETAPAPTPELPPEGSTSPLGPPSAVGEPESEPTRPLFADEAPTAPLAPLSAPAPRASGEATSVVEAATPATTTRTTPATTEPVRTPRRAARSQPRLGGMPAAVLTGAVVGLVAVILIWGSQRGCGAIRGTSTCGGGPGFLLLLAIMVAMVFLGAGLLRVLKVADAGSTSFLGVGLLAVITLLFFVNVIFDWWMAIAIPLCTAGTYALSHWVTATFAEADR